MAYTIKPSTITDQTVSVGTTVLAPFGTSSWTVENASLTDPDSLVTITNLGGTALYVKAVPEGTALSGAVSSTSYTGILNAGEVAEIRLAPGEFLVVVRASGTGNVLAQHRSITAYP